MLMNENEMFAAAQWWRNTQEPGPDADFMTESGGAGPYRLLAALRETGNRSHTSAEREVQQVLQFFPGTFIPTLSQLIPAVCLQQVSLHVMPQWIYDTIDWSDKGRNALITRGCPPPFVNLPTEADLADVFVALMSNTACTPPGRCTLGQAVQAACDKLGWRTVVTLINAMYGSTFDALAAHASILDSPDDVAAALSALCSESARRA